MFACHSIKEVNPLFIFLRVCQKGATKQQPTPPFPNTEEEAGREKLPKVKVKWQGEEVRGDDF